MSELIVNDYPKSMLTESIKTVRTNLRFSSVNKKIKTILMTSSVMGEGKSFISANLATAFANSKEKVLIIDADLRRGRQQKIFDKDSKLNLGLSNLLIDTKWEENLESYIQPTSVKNLELISTGAIPPNPTVLLESRKLVTVINKLKEKYDLIILDAPPVQGLTDSLVLTRLVDAVIIVASTKKATLDLLENTKQALENVGANIAGVILNGVEQRDSKYYGSYTE